MPTEDEIVFKIAATILAPFARRLLEDAAQDVTAWRRGISWCCVLPSGKGRPGRE